MTVPLRTRFSNKWVLDAGTGCWLWAGAGTDNGYGVMWGEYRKEYAHRVSYLLYNGPIPDDMQVLHRCDTPLCVNPEHLFLGTVSDNMKDCSAKGRQRKKVV